MGEDGSKLSGGQKQRIGLARALYSDPEVIFLDEATNALDKKTELAILKTIKKLAEKTTIIIISHDEKTLKICNNRFSLDALV
jgi:ATP-binding cassette subfamily C protein